MVCVNLKAHFYVWLSMPRTELDQIGYESISTAETLLGLILENAFSISCGGQYYESEAPKPVFDVLDIYRRYTSECVSGSAYLLYGMSNALHIDHTRETRS